MKPIEEALKIARDPQRLTVLNQFGLLDTVTEESFDRLTRLASKIIRTPISLVTLIDADRQFFKSMFGLPDWLTEQRESPLAYSFCKHVVADNTPLVIADAREHPILKDNLAVQHLNAVSYLGIPLTTTDGVPLGSFCVIDMTPREWSDEEIEIIRELALSVMTEIELRVHIEQRKKREVALRKAKQEADDANHAKSRFLANMSHELRTPLAAIIGYSELLMEQNQTQDEEARTVKYLSKIKTSGSHLLALINHTLDLAKIEAGYVTLEQHTFALPPLIHELLVSVQPLLDKNGNSIEVTLPPEITTMHNDPQKLRQIMLNLLSNAAKFTHNGQVSLTVTVIDDNIHFVVQDNGIGMNPKQAKYIFAPFMQADALTSQKYGGTGLGLSISQQLCQLMGGKISVTSEEGVGSTFTVQLPYSETS